MHNDLPATFQAADYRVRLSGGGWATIRIGEPLPASLRRLAGTQPWGFVTAWNPRSQACSRQRNRHAQRQLLAALQASPGNVAIFAALGVGDGWRESSLFVTGLDTGALDALAARHGQLAYLHGAADSPVRLRWLQSPANPSGSTPHGQAASALRTIAVMTTVPIAAPLLEARALSFHRQDEPVFAPLDFQLHAGELALVEGDNGSGKTTLMRILAGLLHVSAGELRWRGEPLQRDGCTGEILFLGHQLGLKGDFSPRENLRVAAGMNGRREGLSIAAVLADIGLRGYEDEPVRRLSAGQRKRAALARLLLLPATLWLLDEPYANLDRTGIALVNWLLEAHVARGGAALVTSHGAVSFHGGEPQRIRMHD